MEEEVSRNSVAGSSEKVQADLAQSINVTGDGMDNTYSTHSTVIKIEPEESFFSEDEEEHINDSGLPFLPLLSNETESEIKLETEADSDCPSTLQRYTEQDIFIAFQKCCNKRKSKKSTKQLLLEAVFTTLTQQSKRPNYEEEQFLYNLWLTKYKELFEENKVKKRRKKRVTPVKQRTKQQKLTTNVLDRNESTLSEPRDVIIAPESSLNCPPSLQGFSENAISNAFTVCVKSSRLKLNLRFNDPKSLFGKVSKFLTDKKTSTSKERNYINGLWLLKYKHSLLDARRLELSNCSKRIADQIKSKMNKRQPKKLAAVKGEYKNYKNIENSALTRKELRLYSKNSNDMDIANDKAEGKDTKTIIESSMACPTSSSLTPKIEVESDENDGYSDLDNAPLSTTVSLNRDESSDDPKLKQKVVVSIARLTREGDNTLRRTSARKKLKNRRYCEYSSSEPDQSDQDDREYVNDVEMNYNENVSSNSSGNEDLVLERGSKIRGNRQLNNKNSEGSFETICSVCGRPLSKNLMSFHLRTHFNYEEQKQFLIKRDEKENEMRRRNIKSSSLTVASKETSLDKRIDQLKTLLTGLEKRIARNNPEERAAKRRRYRNRNINVRRYGNYGPVQCDECGKVLRDVYRLKIHKVVIHGRDDEKHKCQICGRPFGVASVLRKHLPRHLSFEERMRFNNWTGSIEEFLERLNTGQDLIKPPIKKKGWGRTRKPGSAPRKMPKRRGRPRKNDEERNSNNDDAVSLAPGHSGQARPEETNQAPENMYSNPYAAFNFTGYANTSINNRSGLEFNAVLNAASSLPCTTVDTSALSWNSYQ